MCLVTVVAALPPKIGKYWTIYDQVDFGKAAWGPLCDYMGFKTLESLWSGYLQGTGQGWQTFSEKVEILNVVACGP